MVEEFRRRRDLIVDGLNAIPGISCIRPKGAFYVFANVMKLGMDCNKLADYLLYEGEVAALPETHFGKLEDGYLRFSYANSQENIKEALERIKEALNRLPT